MFSLYAPPPPRLFFALATGAAASSELLLPAASPLRLFHSHLNSSLSSHTYTQPATKNSSILCHTYFSCPSLPASPICQDIRGHPLPSPPIPSNTRFFGHNRGGCGSKSDPPVPSSHVGSALTDKKEEQQSSPPCFCSSPSTAPPQKKFKDLFMVAAEGNEERE